MVLLNVEFAADSDLRDCEITSVNQPSMAITYEEMLLSDMPNHNIADTLCISINILKKHTYNIYRKLDISSRSQFKALLAENN